jgi:hypothetical protein
MLVNQLRLAGVEEEDTDQEIDPHEREPVGGGETTTGQLSGTASLYSYFASTAVIFLLVLLLPPRSPRNWITARL